MTGKLLYIKLLPGRLPATNSSWVRVRVMIRAGSNLLGGRGGGWQFSRRIFFVYREANMYEIKYQRPHSQKAVMGVDIGF